MDILIVEDDKYKAEELESLLSTVGSGLHFEVATCVFAAVAAVRTKRFDFIVLDMALPSHPIIPGGGAPLSLLNGGAEILFELQSLGRKDCCAVITQFPEIEICGELYPVSDAAEAMERNYGIHIAACLEYSDSSHVWRSALVELMRDIVCES